MSVCIYSVFVLSCAWVAALQWADRSSKESFQLCIGLKTEKVAKAQQGAVEPQTDRDRQRDSVLPLLWLLIIILNSINEFVQLIL
jgi:hypothetical protein